MLIVDYAGNGNLGREAAGPQTAEPGRNLPVRFSMENEGSRHSQ
jgi:hypothetical protein